MKERRKGSGQGGKVVFDCSTRTKLALARNEINLWLWTLNLDLALGKGRRAKLGALALLCLTSLDASEGGEGSFCSRLRHSLEPVSESVAWQVNLKCTK